MTIENASTKLAEYKKNIADSFNQLKEINTMIPNPTPEYANTQYGDIKHTLRNAHDYYQDGIITSEVLSNVTLSFIDTLDNEINIASNNGNTEIVQSLMSEKNIALHLNSQLTDEYETVIARKSSSEKTLIEYMASFQEKNLDPAPAIQTLYNSPIMLTIIPAV
ncbi:hypothetical protein [Yersinia pekkanenii]|uniref:Uncharacterized protein n=1 Tax=Yersinia pekkanenii TaxID=1288385 RepID=A0A0T9NEY4_9GAMM|nr:hypothetical protein [Yersinia pekkanenii]CNH03886.1 Uncharacterised protein [Yersinia pekkanenii]CRY63877.1 Uncharacterised protein [Yersinia pekkanenii]